MVVAQTPPLCSEEGFLLFVPPPTRKQKLPTPSLLLFVPAKVGAPPNKQQPTPTASLLVHGRSPPRVSDLFSLPLPQALARVSSPDWWLKYRGVGSSLKGPWGNVLGVHTISMPLWGCRAAYWREQEGISKRQQQQQHQQHQQHQHQHQQFCRGGQGSYSETQRVLRVKSQLDRKKRSYEAQVVRIQWDRPAVGAQVREQELEIMGFVF